MKKRDASLDVAKGILAVSVVCGHVFTGGRLHSLIYAFHMPAFFIISGILISITEEYQRSPCQIIKRNLLAIGIPYVFFEFIGGITYYVRWGCGQTPFGLIYNSVIMHCNNGPDWFLYVLFISKCLFLLYVKCINGTGLSVFWKMVQCALAISAIVVGILFPGTAWTVSIIRKVAVAYGFLSIGYWGKNLFCSNRPIAGITSIVVVVLISVINESPDMNQLHFGNPVLYILGALFGSYAVIQLSKLIKSKMLSYYGTGSLIVMGTHVPLLFLIRDNLCVEEFTLLEGLAVICIIMMIEYPVIYLIHNYMPWVIGKRKINKR